MNVFEHLTSLLTGQFNALKLLCSLIKLEAKLARLSVMPLIVSLLLLLLALLVFWMSLMALGGYYIFYLTHHIGFSIAGVGAINFIVMLGLIYYVSFNIRAMSFEKTRNYLNHYDEKNDDIEKKINHAN